jgi:hypothetical protein
MHRREHMVQLWPAAVTPILASQSGGSGLLRIRLEPV